ncbi:hypothetical protein [Dactylosporangium sp. NPDC000521]|uniref:hypothetical protein n=1 Tax=Dactylosporangium sp. NPDC000521 TaxID=3363975 RepID=UPI0036741414
MTDVVAFCGLPSRPWLVRALQRRRLAEAAVEFLTLEAIDPQTWRAGPWPWSPWSLKEGVLLTFMVLGAPPAVIRPLQDLITGAVGRPQRCKDHRYWELARTLDDPTLRARLADVATGREESTRLRARFLLWLLDHPQHRTDGRGWWRWLRTEGRPLPDRLAQLGIASLRRPADAAAALTGVPAPDVAAVLESLEFGPAVQIVALLDPVVAAGALSGMDRIRAAQTLRRVPEPITAAILRHMPCAKGAGTPD